MKHIHCITVILVLCVNCSIAQHIPVVEWQRTVGTVEAEAFDKVLPASDGTFVAVGSMAETGGSTSQNAASRDILVVKVNASGDTIWTRTMGGNDEDQARDIAETADGGYIIAGWTESNNGDVSGNHGQTDGWVVKLDISGNLIWQNAIGGAGQDLFDAVTPTADGNFILAGGSSSDDGDVSLNNGGVDCWIVKIDSVGSLIWETTLGGSHNDRLYDVHELNTGELVLSGSTHSSDNGFVTNGQLDLLALKLDVNGGLIWQRSYGGSAHEEGYDIEPMVDGGFIVIGYAISNDGDVIGAHGFTDEWVVKLDSLGDLEWQRPLGGTNNDFGFVAVGVPNGHVIVAGSASSNDGDVTGRLGSFFQDHWLVELDTAGNIVWNKGFGGTNEDRVRALVRSGQHGLIMAGGTFSDDVDVTDRAGHSDAWILKLNFNYGLLEGNVFADLNSNGTREVNELGIPQHQLENLNTGLGYFSDVDGAYTVAALDTGITVVVPDPLGYYTASPVSHAANFPLLQQQTDSLNDFAMQPTGTFNDLQVRITPIGPFRPGFSALYELEYKNVGTTTLPAPELVFIPGPLLAYDSSSVAPSTVFADSIRWQLPSLVPFDGGQIHVRLTVSTIVTPGGPITSRARIEPLIGDANAMDNTAIWTLFAQGSYDPNDMLVDRASLLHAELTPTPPDLTYIVRFQNTGNDTAFTVRILNDFPANADVSAFSFEGASHPVEVNFLHHADRMEFLFNNILLPDSNVNEPASHGYVRYTMKPRSTLMVGDSVLNQAAIYFDFNAPVFTNVVHTIIENTVEVQEVEQASSFLLAPNPATESCTIVAKYPQLNARVTLKDALGRMHARSLMSGTTLTLDLADLAVGVYFISVETLSSTWTEELIVR